MDRIKTDKIEHAKFNTFIETLADTIKMFVQEYMKFYKFDESYRGIVTSDLGNNVYEIEINKIKYKVSCKSRKLRKGEPEWVTVPKGNWNELFIR